MTVRTKSIYDPVEDRDGLRVLITRYYPRGVKRDRFDDWVKALSPSRDLLRSYRSGKRSWKQFAVSFRSELRGEEGREALMRLAALGRDRVVTLLCYEREGLPCHRHLVRQALAEPGILSGSLGKPARRGSPPRSQGSSARPASGRRIHFYSRRKVAGKAPK